MQPFETWLKADLQAPVTVKRIDGNLFSGDNQGNLVGVTVTDAGEPATLSGEVRGYFIRSDGNTVIMSGTIDGNKVTVVLPSACYTVVGQFSLVIKVGQVAVGACTGYVYQSNTDSTVDPEHVIPDIDQLLTRVEALEGRATTLEGDVSAQNNTINAIEDGLAIIATGNVHPAIANGQFVYVKGHSSLAEGLYRATAAIGTNATLSTSNLTADGSGGLNALKGDLDSLNSNMLSKEFSPASGDSLLTWILSIISNRSSLPFSFAKIGEVEISDTPFSIKTTEFSGIVYGNNRRMIVEVHRYSSSGHEKWSRCIFDNAWYGSWEAWSNKVKRKTGSASINANSYVEYALSDLGFTTPTGYTIAGVIPTFSGSGTAGVITADVSDVSLSYVCYKNLSSSAKTINYAINVIYTPSGNIENV